MKRDAEMEPAPGWVVVGQAVVEFPQAIRVVLDPEGTDPGLRRMVVIGHSQGGLLTKMTAIDSGSRLWDARFKRPLESLDVSPQTRDVLRRTRFVTPLPFVKRVVFLATRPAR